MATYLPVRAFNRSQNVRIGKQKVSATVNTYIDVDDAVSRKELGYHSAIGAVYHTGPLTDHNKAALITSGFATDTQSGSAPTNKVQTIASGVYVNRDTATVVSVSGADTITNIALAASGKKRIDLVYLDTADNAFKITTGTEVASAGTAVAPTATSTQIALFTVAVSDSAIATAVDVRVLY
jgi:hypothetical protein